MMRVAVLGSTGSIGVSTLDVLARHPDRFSIAVLAARSNDAGLIEQCLRHQPAIAVLESPASAERLAAALRAAGSATEVRCGAAALAQCASSPDVDAVMAAIVGAAGLPSTLAAARAGKRVLLANKESLVVAGPLLVEAARAGAAQLVPIDSEHNAIFQCMPPGADTGRAARGVNRVLLTASGGPFLRMPVERMASVTPDEACAHPRWRMGRKISVDSATLMNKGLELIEACLLFGMEPRQVEVVVHPQSIVHSMVEYVDGSILAQLGNPDMRTPIAHALGWPERIGSGVQSLDIVAAARLDFEAPDTGRFPALKLARDAAEAGGTAPAVLNAANEIAVGAFLGGTLGFLGIPRLIETVLGRHVIRAADSLETVLEADRWARELAEATLA
ncbi:MAG: 1-deoxy-D-xylulose-5-phosphate reductoisomerase [Pseudomonadota bacterium]|jgi:1-deoxy-D-xylulose-5-phosphate reductoisomerase|nr:1-deoxy-D-xylulose-5-phosphate reductoisomerase [Pseudomonadota bacterium]